MYAQVVVGLPIDGPFDYFIPPEFRKKINLGSRVGVSFGFKNLLGYVVSLSTTSSISKVKPIRTLIDETPLIDPYFLSLAKELSLYYCCSWGEALETIIPAALRKGKRSIEVPAKPARNGGSVRNPKAKPEYILLHDAEGFQRWDFYFRAIAHALQQNTSTILLLPETSSLQRIQRLLGERLKCEIASMYRQSPEELENWGKIKRGFTGVVIGTRSAIFAPLHNVGLIIIDEEQDPSYKQDQVPHYHCREVAWWRAKKEHATLLLGSVSPSLESMYLVKKGKLRYQRTLRKRNFPEVKTLETFSVFLSRYLLDAIASVLQQGGKVLLYLNRRGFATVASCQSCHAMLKCPRCDLNLVHHFKEKSLRCHHCNFSMEPPQVCPVCNAGYIKYTGYGTEKIESELSRVFPQAKITQIESASDATAQDSDICIATQVIFKQAPVQFDLVGILSIDSSLNRVDFRATEKIFGVLLELCGLTEKKMIIQTSLSGHYCFRALESKDELVFYDEELSRRKQLRFPPFSHLGMIKLRAVNQEKVKEATLRLYEYLKQKHSEVVTLISCNAGLPEKMRGNYYWQILASASSAKKLTRFLKICLKEFSHSGIIVTVDIDPL